MCPSGTPAWSRIRAVTRRQQQQPDPTPGSPERQQPPRRRPEADFCAITGIR
jgi:hypothetical protein